MVGRVVVGVAVVEVEGLVGEVASKGDSSNAQARERALESVPARKGTGISPGLAVGEGQSKTHGQVWEQGGRTIWPRGRLVAGQRRQQTFEGRNQ
jgi:hypothetical protein